MKPRLSDSASTEAEITKRKRQRMLSKLLTKVIGSRNDRTLRRLRKIVDQNQQARTTI